jgi:hypothetical protein
MWLATRQPHQQLINAVRHLEVWACCPFNSISRSITAVQMPTAELSRLLPTQGAVLRQMRAFVEAAADSRYVALPQTTARVAALQTAASSLVYDVLMLRVGCFQLSDS